MSKESTVIAADLRELSDDLRLLGIDQSQRFRNAVSLIERQAAAIAQARTCALAIWPRGNDCEHTQARELFNALDGL